MRYTLSIPCGNCPFRREGFIPLREARVYEIAGVFINGHGGEFPCHKTTVESEDDELGGRRATSDSLHCAGALIFAEKNETPTQMMRICERLGEYDASKLEPYYHLVFDSVDEMVEAHEIAQRPKRRKRRA